MTRARCWRAVSDGIRVAVKVTPRARAGAVGGLAASADGPRLRIAVTAAPEDGRASAAACIALARALDLPAGAVALHAGGASRAKILHISGAPVGLAARLDALATPPTAPESPP